jgi:GWxTD domain-containing protein
MSKERPRKRVAESSVLVDNLSVDKLRSGTYSLVLSVLDSGKQVLAQSGKKFFVYNPTLGVDSTLLASAASLPLQVYMSMQEPELDREFQWLRYESTDAEKGQYKELKGTEAKRKFMSDFWRKRSPEHRDEYLVRVGYTNSNFQMLGKEGYKTDRGRVYIMYGPPDDVERHPNESETRPYEIWSYNNIQGGVIFVFVQRNSGGDYELVHSTHRNELRDDNWDRVGITR